MFARHTYVTGDPRRIDDAITATQKKGREMLREQPGYSGMAIFADRDLGKLLIGSFWDSEQACRDSDAALREQRAELWRPFAATISAEIFEIASVHRSREAGEGAAMRRVVLEHEPADADRLVEAFNSQTAEMRSVAGLCRATVFVDRGRGRSVIGLIYADRESLIASRSAAAGMRAEVNRRVEGLSTRSLEEFEVVLTENLPAAR
jgi:heme-degrading monooxygenase HmoA